MKKVTKKKKTFWDKDERDIKLFYLGVGIISFICALIFSYYFIGEKETQTPTPEQAQEDFKNSFKFFAENGPKPNTPEEYNGMVLTYVVNKEVLN